jgi:hypothetical protein
MIQMVFPDITACSSPKERVSVGWKAMAMLHQALALDATNSTMASLAGPLPIQTESGAILRIEEHRAIENCLELETNGTFVHTVPPKQIVLAWCASEPNGSWLAMP